MSEQVSKGLGDLLSVEQLKKLYFDPMNGFGSRALQSELERYTRLWREMASLESGDKQRYNTLKIQKALNETNDALRKRYEPIIEELLNRHSATKAEHLEKALSSMRLAPDMKLTPKQIAKLPRNVAGHIDDSIGAMGSGTSMLLKQYIHELEMTFVAPSAPSLGRY